MIQFPGKIILFGEYTLLSGSKGLALPFQKFSGKLSYWIDSKNKAAQASSNVLRALAAHIQQQDFHAIFIKDVFKKELNEGLYFESNIPQGYGLGSSGALVAALYQYFFVNKSKLTIAQIKDDLAQIEAYFHGTSSGTDPLVSYLKSPIVLEKGSVRKTNFSPGSDLQYFLIDTQITAKTEGLVTYYQSLLKEKNHKKKLERLQQHVNYCIEASLAKTLTFSMVQELSQMQRALLPPMFVSNPSIDAALQKFPETLTTKLCGSGGGGFLLGIAQTPAFSAILNYFANIRTKILPL